MQGVYSSEIVLHCMPIERNLAMLTVGLMILGAFGFMIILTSLLVDDTPAPPKDSDWNR